MEDSWSENQETCGVINAWNENSQSDDDGQSVLSVRTIYDQNGLEPKKLLNIRFGWEIIINMNILVVSASLVSFLKQNVLHDLKLGYPNLKIQPVDKQTNQLYCGLTDSTINSLGKIIVLTQSNSCICEETHFFITGMHERNILGNDILPKLGIEVKQKKCPVPICTASDPLGKSKSINLEISTN